MAEKLLDDCFLHDKDRLSHDDAIGLILDRLKPVADTETVELEAAHERVLAEAVTARRDIPAFSNAAVDGYALRGADLGGGHEPTRLKVTGRAAAGQARVGRLGEGEAARIFTGAVMPDGADTCVMQEDVTRQGEDIIIPPGLKPGANTRAAGEDVKAGAEIVGAGTRLRPQEVAAIASTGQERIRVYRSLRLALLSTGDELVRPGEVLGDAQVYDSNHFLLRGLADTVAADVTDFGIIHDDRRAVERAISKACTSCDVIVTTGGASRGEADFVVDLIRSMGKLHAWQLAVKPGRPLAIGQVGDCVFLGLPGNPVAAFVTFLLYGQPMLARLQGANWQPPRRYRLPAGFEIPRKKKDRREFWRCWIEDTDEGPVLRKFAHDGSGLITGLREAAGLVEAGEEVGCVRHGDLLNFIPFGEFGLRQNL